MMSLETNHKDLLLQNCRKIVIQYVNSLNLQEISFINY